MTKYDVIIAGGGTAGVSLAWNTAKRGLKTLLIEKNSFLGGSITSSLVIPAMKTADNAINNDFYNELYDNLYKINGSITYSDNNKGWLNPELTKIILDKMLIDVNVDILFNSRITSIEHKDNKILSVCIETLNANNINDFYKDLLSAPIETSNLVDATGDAEICQKLNCSFLDNLENLSQPMSLRFIMSGVNLKIFKDWLLEFDSNREVTTGCTVDGQTHLSTAYTWDDNNWALKPLFDKAIAEGVLEVNDSNYFQIFTVAGCGSSIAFNAPRLVESLKNPYIEARSAILRLSNFCRIYLPGFEDAFISSIANSMGVRVSNRVKGKYVYTYEDLISSKEFKNPVVISNYPIDIHSDTKNKSILKKINKEYQLPLESLLVEGYDNLYVVGRCLSADFKAQAALRIIPSCFSMGEGLAKYLANNTNLQNC